MMMSVWSSPSPASFWKMASIEIARSAQDARDVGQHAGPVERAHAQVVAGLDLVHRQDREVRQLVRLERQVRHAVLGVGGVHARDVDQVGDHGAGGGLGAGAAPVEERRADRVAFHQHGVHHAFPLAISRRAGISVGCTRSSMPFAVRRVMPISLMR